MTMLERRSLAEVAARSALEAALKPPLSELSEAVERRRKAPCQDRKYARSGRAADAVRGHAFCRAPARSVDAALERFASSFFVTLTPARWGAMRVAAKLLAIDGCGVAVLARTAQNLAQNRQLSEIAGQCAPVLRFQLCASRHARAGAHAQAHARICARETRTSEPDMIIYIIHVDRGSERGSARFSPEPRRGGAGEGRGFPSISNKIGGGYVAAARDLASRGLMLSGGGETFGVFGLGDRGVELELGADRGGGRIGGNPPFFDGRRARVGTSMLERWRKRRGKPLVSAVWHLPIGQEARADLGGRGTPPCPHRRRAAFLPRWRRSVAEFGSASPFPMTAHCAALENRPRRGWGETGPGEALRCAGSPARKPGRGSGDAAGKLRRSGNGSGGAGRVK